jgi:hypothetical protein
MTIVVEFSQHLHSIVLSINGHQVARTFWEEDHANGENLQTG